MMRIEHANGEALALLRGSQAVLQSITEIKAALAKAKGKLDDYLTWNVENNTLIVKCSLQYPLPSSLESFDKSNEQAADTRYEAPQESYPETPPLPRGL
jgi:hypothetical protein